MSGRVGAALERAWLVDGHRVGEVDDEHHVLVEHGLRHRFDLRALGVAAEQRKDAAVVVFQATLVDDDVIRGSTDTSATIRRRWRC